MESLLEKLQGDGDFESIGRFTLDPSKAREKLQKFQLVDPHAYAVHLVAAAVASGATRIDLHQDAGDLRVDFDGRAFTAEEVENLFASLFASERQESLVRLQELAIGINAALVSNPRWVDVESWNEREGIHLRVYADRERLERVRPRVSAGLTTRIQVRQRVGLKTVLRYLSLFARPALEQTAVRERCSVSPVPIRINGEQISQAPTVAHCLVLTRLRGGRHELELDCPEVSLYLDEDSPGDYSAWLSLEPDRQLADSTLHWVVNGVSYVQSLGYPGRAWVVSSNMPKDVSQVDLVQGEEWERIGIQLLEARMRQLQALARAYPELDEARQSLARELLLDTLAGRLAHGQPCPEELRPLVEAPLLTLAHGPPVSLWELLEQSRQLGWVHCVVTEGRWPCPPLQGTKIVYLDAPARRCVSAAFRLLQPGDWDLAEAQQAQENRRTFEQGIPGEMQFERGVTVYLEELLAGPSFRAVLGLSTRSAPAQLGLYKGGRYLGRKLYPRWPEGLQMLADHNELEPNLKWDGVREDQPALREVEEALRGALPSLYARAAEQAQHSTGELRQELERALVAFLVYCVDESVEPGPVAEFPLFSGHTYTELCREYARLGHLPVTDRYPDVKPLDDTLIVKATPHLEQLFKLCRSYDHELRAAKQAQDTLARWESSPRVGVKVPEQAFLVRLALPDGSGELALPAGAPHNTVQLYFFREERSLGKRYFPGTPGLGGLPAGLQVALSDDNFPRDSQWAGSSDGPILENALERLRPFIDQLFGMLGEVFPEFEPARRWAQAYLGGYLSWAPLQPDQALLQAPTLDGVGSRHYSLRNLVTALERDGVVLAVRTDRPLDDLSDLSEPFLRLSDELWSALERWLGPGSLRDGTDEYQRALNSQAFWQGPPREPRLDDELFLRTDLEVFPGELGLTWEGAALPGLHLSVDVLYKGRLLVKWALSVGPLAGVPQVSFGRLRAIGVVEASHLTPSPQWDELAAGPECEELREQLRCAARRLFLALALRLPELQPAQRDEALAYLWGHLKAETGRQDRGMFEDVRRDMTRAPIFPLLGGGWVSLVDLRAAIDKHERVGYLVGSSDAPPGEEPIVLVRRELLPLLRSLLGVQHTADASVTVRALGRATAHRRAPPVAQLQLPEHPYLAVGVLGGEREGRVGLSPTLGGSSRVQLLLERRPLDERRLELPFTVEALVNDDHLRPNRDYTAVADGPELTRALQAVIECGNQLVLGLALSCTGAPSAQKPELREFVVRVACRMSRGRLVSLDDQFTNLARPPGISFFRDLEELPLFPTPDGGRVTLEQIRSAPRVLALPAEIAAEPRPEELLPEGCLALLLSEPEELALAEVVSLVRYLPGYQAAAAFYLAHCDEGFLRLPAANYLATFELAMPLRGQVGWLRSGQQCALQLYWRGREVHRFTRPGYPCWQAVVDDHRLEFEISGPRLAPDELFLEVNRQLQGHIQEKMTRTDWLAPEERRVLWLELALSDPQEWLRQGPILVSTGPLRSLRDVIERRFPYVLEGEALPTGSSALVLSELEAELLQKVVGPLPLLATLAPPALPPCLVSIRYEEGDLVGELGIAVDPRQARVELRHAGRVVAREDLFPGPGFVGWMEGPFGPDLMQARRLLYRLPEELLRELCQRGLGPGTIRALASWPPFQSPGPHLPDWLWEAPLFPSSDGRCRTLRELQTAELDYIPRGSARPQGRSVLELEPGSEALSWLEQLLGRTPQLYLEPVLTSEQRLRHELGAELQALMPDELPWELELTEGVPSWLFELRLGLEHCVVALNRAHPLVQRLLVRVDHSSRYLLLSALAGQVNCQRLQPADRRQADRELHQRLLERLNL